VKLAQQIEELQLETEERRRSTSELVFILDYSESQLDANAVLYEKRPPCLPKPHISEGKALRAMFDSLEQKVSPFYEDNIYMLGMPVLRVISDILAYKLEEIESASSVLAKRMYTEIVNLLVDFEKETKHATHLLRTFSYITWVLYPTGVMVGILGELAGVAHKRSNRELKVD
jgi:hypothetical protein